MTAVSLALLNGVDGFKVSDFTVGTAAPTAGQDFELRFNLTDQASHNITSKAIVIAIKAFIRAVEDSGSNVSVFAGLLGPP